jgi:hypothetical protein
MMRLIGLIPAGGNYDNLRKNIQRLNINTDHWCVSGGWSKDKRLKDWSLYKRGVNLKPHLIRDRGLQCEQCKLSTWNEKPISLEVHHIDGDRNNNDVSNLMLISPEDHAKLHEDDFVKWSRIGAALGNAAFIKRLEEKGPTDKEKLSRNLAGERAKKGLHRVPHSMETKKSISDNKKRHFQNKFNHPMWGKTAYEVESPAGEKQIVSFGWKEWCQSKGLSPSNLRSVALGTRTHHKGWKAKII